MRFKLSLWKLYYLFQAVYKLRFLPDKLFLQLKFYRYQKKFIDFKNPKSFNEKIQFLKLYDRKQSYHLYADKENSKQIAKEVLGKDGVLKTQYTFDSVGEISFEKLNFPCVIKTNKGSGDFFLLRSIPNPRYRDSILFSLAKSLERDLYLEKREYQYKNIIPKIIVEDMLLDSKKNIPQDYKVHCFNNKPEFIYVTTGREGNTYRGIYDLNWKPINMIWSHLDKSGKPEYNFKNDIPKPKNLNEIIDCSKQLAHLVPSPYIRIDLFNVDEQRLVFGEFTFHHMSGYAPIFPFEKDLYFGSRLHI